MKKKSLCILLTSLFAVLGCQKEDCSGSAEKDIQLPGNHQMSVPNCFQLINKEGIEAAIGSIVDQEGREILAYSIGPWADFLVSHQVADVVTDSIGKNRFIYQLRPDLYKDPHCCWHITFPDQGIPNRRAVTFKAYQDNRWDQALRMLRSLD